MARSTDTYLEQVERILGQLEAEVDRVRRSREDLDRTVQVVEEGTGDGNDERT